MGTIALAIVWDLLGVGKKGDRSFSDHFTIITLQIRKSLDFANYHLILTTVQTPEATSAAGLEER
jgi:hypothetical protein